MTLIFCNQLKIPGSGQYHNENSKFQDKIELFGAYTSTMLEDIQKRQSQDKSKLFGAYEGAVQDLQQSNCNRKPCTKPENSPTTAGIVAHGSQQSAPPKSIVKDSKPQANSTSKTKKTRNVTFNVQVDNQKTKKSASLTKKARVKQQIQDETSKPTDKQSLKSHLTKLIANIKEIIDAPATQQYNTSHETEDTKGIQDMVLELLKMMSNNLDIIKTKLDLVHNTLASQPLSEQFLKSKQTIRNTDCYMNVSLDQMLKDIANHLIRLKTNTLCTNDMVENENNLLESVIKLANLIEDKMPAPQEIEQGLEAARINRKSLIEQADEEASKNPDRPEIQKKVVPPYYNKEEAEALENFNKAHGDILKQCISNSKTIVPQQDLRKTMMTTSRNIKDLLQ